ncbi:MAG: UvrD-helicase domain-containing protein [Planctomycetota bacterium]
MAPLDWMDAKAVAGGGGFQDEQGPDDPDVGAELLDGLNDAQRQAVVHGEGPLLILAGAGSGKTRVITRRVAWLVATGRAAPHELLAITFTNKAAGEMRERVQSLLPDRGYWISTFHSMCARILRSEIDVLGSWTRDFSIYDTYDRNQLLKRIIKDAGYDAQRFRPGAVGGWISDGKNRARTGEGDHAPAGEGVDEEVLRVVRDRYAKAMEEANALDFDDLLLITLRIFDEHTGVRDAYASRFRYVLVDEYQDTNRVQYLLARHLASWHKNLAVCGDPDQSIYAWRGADVRNILDFEEDFGRAMVVKLEQNYRSVGNVLKAAQALIANNDGRKEKDLWTEREDGELLSLLECGDENDEASEICLQVQSLRSRGSSLNEMAVFYRVNFMQRPLERAFRLAGVPYQIVGGVEFYQRREIRDLLAYLQLVANPRDDVAFRRVVNIPARGVGDKSIAVLSAWAGERGMSLREAAAEDEARAGIRGRGKAGLLAFAQLMDTLDGLREQPAEEVLLRVIDEVDYMGWLAGLDEPDLANREENVEELVSSARTYDQASPEGKLRGFLQDVALVSDVDAFDASQECVTLMTLHAAKGLEFPYVFIAGLEEQLLPHPLAITDVEDEVAGLEEERRLLYVGLTRAQERLFLTHARTRLHFGETSWRTPSRFLDELPNELLDGLTPDDDDGDSVLGDYQEPSGGPELSEGDWVVHEHFGRGQVARLQGAGINARATVAFEDVGSKVLLLQYANLKVLKG